MKRYLMLALVALPLVLSGCVEAISRLAVEGAYLADSTSAYVREVHDLRRWIREQCFDLLKIEIRALGDDTGKIRQLLIDSYPPLVTVGVVRDRAGGLFVPFGCKGVDLIEPVE